MATHLALASQGDWPNWAACGRRVPKRQLSAAPAEVTCSDCMAACAGAYAAAQARHG